MRGRIITDRRHRRTIQGIVDRVVVKSATRIICIVGGIERPGDGIVLLHRAGEQQPDGMARGDHQILRGDRQQLLLDIVALGEDVAVTSGPRINRSSIGMLAFVV